MTYGLPVSNVVRVDINMSPVAARPRDFGTLLIAGTSPVIDVQERLRLYANIDEVAADFGTLAKEYLAAQLYFGQSPRPTRLYIGRWAQTATSAYLYGAVLTAAQQEMANFTTITTGTMTIKIDGTDAVLTGLDFSGASNLNGVAAIVATALAARGTCTWDAARGRFTIKSGTIGALSTIQAAVNGTTSNALGVSVQANPSAPVNGIPSETPVAAVAIFTNQTSDWYGLMFSDMTVLTDAQHIAIADHIEAADPSRIYGIGSQNAAALDVTNSSDIGSVLKAKHLERTFVVYSSTQPLAPASVFGRAFTVNFAGSRTAITLKFKQLPGVTAEMLTTTQAHSLDAKHVNVFVNYANDTAILQQGTMASGAFFDERHGLDWLQNDLQTRLYNRLYTSLTKVPQTDAGQTDLITVVEAGLGQAAENGLVAPGRWTTDGFGQLVMNDMLPKGYYIYSAPMADQSQADREARMAQPIQCAIKLAGAVHFVNVAVNVNR